MKNAFLPQTAFLALLLALPAQADLPTAERLLREGQAAAALEELQLEPHSPATLYWKGRALLALKRFPQAAEQFAGVSPESVFYPYAAKGIIYCAWQSPRLDFVELVAPLTASSNEEIATLSHAALAEHQLRNTTHGDVSTLEPLRKLATKDEALRPMVQLLNIEEMRRQKRFAEAIEACRAMEADSTLPLIMRQRVRLALAEIYYDKTQTPVATPTDTDDDDDDIIDDSEGDEGKGEETLLHFISSQADSPLLEEAFRRLDTHNAFTESSHARIKLDEWSTELTKPHRAALAMAVLQRLQQTDADATAEDVKYANTAATKLPNEQVSQLIISEQVRRLINRGDIKQAKLYLDMLPEDNEDPRYLFYKACCLPHNSKEAVDCFLRSAEIASTDIQSPALCNAMYCAMQAGEQDVVDNLLTKELPPRIRRELLLKHAGLILHRNPAQAQAEIESAQLLSPTPEEQVEMVLQLAELKLLTDPAAALQTLQNTETESLTWNYEQELRFYSLQVQATEQLLAAGASLPPPTELLRQAINTSKRATVRRVLAFNLAHRLSETGNHNEALQLLLEQAEQAPNSTLRARALLLAGRQAEMLGSYKQLLAAVQYFQEAGEFNTPYAHRAKIRQARILAWINRGEEAQAILQPLLRQNDISATDKAVGLSVLAHNHMLRGTDEGFAEAIEANRQIFEIEGLSRDWLVRSKLQQATLYTRAERTDVALNCYLELIEDCPKQEEGMTAADWFVLYFAGAGAINQYVTTEKYAEAALLADKIASWPHPSDEKSRYIGSGERAKQFADWSDSIRKLHFLPSVRTRREATPAR